MVGVQGSRLAVTPCVLSLLRRSVALRRAGNSTFRAACALPVVSLLTATLILDSLRFFADLQMADNAGRGGFCAGLRPSLFRRRGGESTVAPNPRGEHFGFAQQRWDTLPTCTLTLF